MSESGAAAVNSVVQFPQALRFDRVEVPVATVQPEGWKAAALTEEMYRAFWATFEREYEHRGHIESTNAAYEAMIAARPR